MTADNPYQSPTADLTTTTQAGEVGKIDIMSSKGRLGRVRYIAYSTALTLVVAIVFGLIGGLGAALGQPGGGVGGIGMVVLMAVAGVAVVVVSIMLTIQRVHDFNTTGWLSVLAFVPLVGWLFVLALWIIPGTDGSNTYGHKTPPNGAGVIALACIAPLLFIIGMLAAIAIPAYQDYAQRALQSRNISISTPPSPLV